MNLYRFNPATLRSLMVAGLFALAAGTSVAQDTGQAEDSGSDGPVTTKDLSMREVLEVSEKAERIVEEKEASDPDEIASGATPLAAMLGLRRAFREGDYTGAGAFLDMRYLPEELDDYNPEELIRALSLVWSQQNIIDIGALSDDPKGDLQDDLPSYRDQVGSVQLATEDIPIYLQRVPDGQGGRTWKLSNATVARIPDMWDELGYSEFAIEMGNMLPEFTFLGMTNWQFVSTVMFFLFAWPIAMLVSYLLMRLALLIPNGFPLGIERFFRGPMRFFIFILMARVMINELGLSLTARVLLDSSGVNYIAFTVLILGLLSLIRDYYIRRMERAGNLHSVALLKPVTTIIKVLVFAGILLFWADSAGYNMTTIIAGLGVGSLAVALAAQKTLENLIGALTLYTARPVDPGNLCRFGSVVGTIEEIGLRSTVIRTLDRSRLVVPNSLFASGEVENLSARDRMRYYRNIRLQLMSADQLRFILAELRKLYYSHPEILPATVSIRLELIEDATALLRMDSCVNTTDFQTYLAVAEDLNLRIIEIVHGAGAIFSGPGQQMQLLDTPAIDKTRAAQAEATLAEWREQDRLPFPNPSDEEIAALKSTLDYPPKGSSA